MPDTLTFTSVHTISGTNKSAAFTSKTSEVFKEEHNIAPIIISDKMKYIPWGGDNQMPYNIIDLIESDETMSTLARCSTPKSAMEADLSMTQSLPPHKCKRKWMTSCWETVPVVFINRGENDGDYIF